MARYWCINYLWVDKPSLVHPQIGQAGQHTGTCLPYARIQLMHVPTSRSYTGTTMSCSRTATSTSGAASRWMISVGGWREPLAVHGRWHNGISLLVRHFCSQFDDPHECLPAGAYSACLPACILLVCRPERILWRCAPL